MSNHDTTLDYALEVFQAMRKVDDKELIYKLTAFIVEHGHGLAGQLMSWLEADTRTNILNGTGLGGSMIDTCNECGALATHHASGPRRTPRTKTDNYGSYDHDPESFWCDAHARGERLP